jgi:hypothetical protein
MSVAFWVAGGLCLALCLLALLLPYPANVTLFWGAVLGAVASTVAEVIMSWERPE